MKPRHSKPVVTPSGYLTGGNELLKKPWLISYYYFDTEHPKGQQIRIKGMNFARTLSERRTITKALINNEIKLLSEGYNPITKERTFDLGKAVNPYTSFIQALKMANSAINVEEQTRSDIKYVVDRIERHAAKAGLLLTPISEIKRKDIVFLLGQCLKVDKVSAYRYNKIKAYLSILYSYLASIEAIEHNFIIDIAIMKKTVNLRTVITPEERARLYKLEATNYNFFRFLNCFFYSGSRESELLRLKAKEVNLDKQEFKVLIKKGSYCKEEMKPITNEALTFWQQLLKMADPEDFVFSVDLQPGPSPTRRNKITLLYKTLCKDGLGIKADMYTLKHAHLDDVARVIGMRTAQALAGHTSPATTLIYAQQEKARRMEELKKMNLSL